MFDHEYTLVAHPRLRARVSYRREGNELGAATVRLDYRRDDGWTEAGTAVDLPEPADEATVDWRGFRVALYRDGEPVVAREVSSGLASDARDAMALVERVAPSVARRVERTARSLASRAPGTVQMRQPDGSTVEALDPPAQAGFEVYRDEAGKWRWRLVHDNGNVLADSGQGYSSRRAAQAGLRSVKRNALGAPVERVDAESERDVRTSSDAERDAGGDRAGTDDATDRGSAEP
ncbi:HVO_2922 family protein [Halorussus halobius]|uniref:HVO_2922 family protein n=1 Tax=Halorussus halobius TaxID=1710537 RepID=UPI0010932E0C|nr:HVO_2922 family protein [Halorussus halobius]